MCGMLLCCCDILDRKPDAAHTTSRPKAAGMPPMRLNVTMNICVARYRCCAREYVYTSLDVALGY